MTNPPEADVLGYRLASVSLDEATTWCLAAVKDATPKLLVTLNPEIIVQAQTDAGLQNALINADLRVADGVGVLWAARQAGVSLPERVSGVDLVTSVLQAGGAELSVFFLGAKPGVAQRAAELAARRYGTRIAGVQHGYFERTTETSGVIQRVGSSGATLLLAGLGEGQELFLYQHKQALGVPLMVGVGGTLDVLSGRVTRSPAWTRQLGLEWAYRVGLSPERWHRFPRLVAFARLALRHSAQQPR